MKELTPNSVLADTEKVVAMARLGLAHTVEVLLALKLFFSMSKAALKNGLANLLQKILNRYLGTIFAISVHGIGLAQLGLIFVMEVVLAL